MGLIVYLARARPERYLGVLGILYLAGLAGAVSNLLAVLGATEGSYRPGDPLALLSLFSVTTCGSPPNVVDLLDSIGLLRLRGTPLCRLLHLFQIGRDAGS